jgi:hypothetical protein
MPFDPAAITAPFRMQPGLRRVAPGMPAVHAAPPGSPAFVAKLAALARHADQCLVASPGVDAQPALRAIATTAAHDCPGALTLSADTARLVSPALGLAVDLASGSVTAGGEPHAEPHADARAVLTQLAPEWRATALACLALLEDFALIDAASVSLPWMAVCLPSHWDPREKAGHGFAAVHAPVADSDTVRAAGAHLCALVSGTQIWERFVWTLTPWPGLDQHPERHPTPPWPDEAQADAAALLALATLRTERQGFIPLPAGPSGQRQAVFTIEVQARPLHHALAHEAVHPAALAAALASMSDAVLDYRGLTTARDRLLAGLHALVATAPDPA